MELDHGLNYLVSTPTIGLTYHKTGTTTPKLIGYVDADHAGDSDNRRSRTGYIYRLEPNGPISWKPVKILGPTDSFARSCPKRPCAVRPCSHSVALPCSFSHCLPPRTSSPAVARASRSTALRLTTCCSLHVTRCCSLHVALCCSAPHALLQPAHRALLPCASRLAVASASHPTAASASRSAALRVAPCCSQRVAPYCSQRVAPCCPVRRALLQPARHALLQPARRALLPCASRPAAASASCPTAALRVAPCCSQRVAPCFSQRVVLCCPSRCALLPCTARALLPFPPPPPSRPAATTAAATAHATAVAGGGAARSAGSAAGAGGAGGVTGSAGGTAGAGVAVAKGGHRRSLPLPDDPTPQQLPEWRCVTGSVEAAALGDSESAAELGASESASALGALASPATGPSSAEALHTFTRDSGALRCFFRDCTTLTPLAALVVVSLADPTWGPVVARASTVLSCPAVPSSSLSGLHLPTFSTNLVSNAAIQDVWVDTFILGGQRVAICTCSRAGRHLATFTRRPGSSLYTLTTAAAQVAEVGQVAASIQVSASGQLAVSCSCWVLSHQTLLWHHLLGHPSLPRLRGMHSRLLVSGLPRSLPSIPRSPAPPCLPCVEGRQRAAPHSSEFPPTTAPLQTLHMDVWGPAPVGGTDQERYFMLVVDDYICYTTVFPLRRKVDINGVLIPWIRATRRQLRERFSRDFPVLRLHSDRGGDFSSDLAEFCQDEGIVQSFTLPASPQQNGIAEHCIGLIMEVARTSMIHAAAPHFLWPFGVRYAAHQLNLWPRVSKPEISLRLRWTGKVGDASVFRGLAPSGVSQVDPPPLVEPLEISSDSSGPAEGGDPVDDTAATRRFPRLETTPGFPPRPSSPSPQPAVVDSGAETAGAEPGGAEKEGEGSGGAATGGAGSWGAETGGAGSWGVATGGADFGGPVSPSGGGAVGDPAGGPGAGQPMQPDLLETLSPQVIRAWIVRRGSPGGGGYSPAGAGAASPGGTVGAGCGDNSINRS
ncbi:unnamed protein product [Closterium sp. NIES-54]